ncbi:hypothetical protein V5O48_006136 [Marasmius crinis-equi]|uniref:Flavin-containing monooxygenase n=1 Tax=Marasmius crinis-equi TaxID=585013 RepID=A0ABR3FL84_9AGAR
MPNDFSTSPPSLPPHHPVPDSLKQTPGYPSEVAKEWLKSFSTFSSLDNLFLADSYWRDLISFTSDVRTLRGFQAQIKPFIENRARKLLTDKPQFELFTDKESLWGSSITEMFPDLAFLQFAFNFHVSYGGKGTGIIRLVYTGSENEGVRGWKAFTVFTCLDELDGVVQPVGTNRPAKPITEPWSEFRKAQNEFVEKDPEVLIVGAGQTGLEVAARLKQLGVTSLAIEKNERIGDNWRKRYDSLSLHDTVWYDTPPYLSFPTTWPVYCSGGKLANFLESYAETLELAVWTSTTMTNTSYDESSKVWTVELARNSGEKRTIKVRHIVFGTGFGGGVAYAPNIPEADKFKGKICHSSEFKSARYHKGGGKAVVVGACNSGYDIAQDFVRHGVDVTMYQRNSTYVISEKGIRALLDPSYNETNLPYIDRVDRANASIPYPILKIIQQRVTPALAGSIDKQLLDDLKRVGFMTNMGGDGAGVFPLLYEKAGGYYLDTGGCQDIIDGKIKLIAGAGGGIKQFTPDGLIFNDGSKIDGVDVVVFATGYGDAAESILPFLPSSLKPKLQPIWGLNEEGELNSVWRGTGVPGVWVGIGNLAMCRYWSEILSLQIKSSLMGDVLPVKY